MSTPASLLLAIGLSVTLLLALLMAGVVWLRRADWRQMRSPGRKLGWLVGTGLGVRRTHATGAMRRAGITGPEATADAMYAQLGRGLLELLWVAVHPKRSLRPLVELDDALVRRLRAAPGGVVIATAHTGNWDLAACAAAAHVPLTVATKHLSVRWLDRIWQGTRRVRGVRLADAGQIARAASQALGRGESVAMLVDQAPERERATVTCPFLGQTALVDLAPALVAMRARAELLAVFPRRRADGVTIVELCGAFTPPARPERRWAEESMRRITAALDGFVRKHPDQWLWMHRRWKGVPERSSARPEARPTVVGGSAA